ncbi:MAG: hypothetical protein V4527_14615 [Pseudomonadota bacterium]
MTPKVNPFESLPRGTVRRDQHWIEREYGREKWPAVLAEARRLIAGGETRLGALLWNLTIWEYGDDLDSEIEVVLLGKRVRMPTVSALAGFYELIRSSILRSCRPDTKTILDLGAGWGRSLFLAWENGAPRSARYGCLEYTPSGRDCAELIASAAPGMRLKTAYFDLRAPELSSWRNEDHTVVFSVYGVEQVPDITTAFFEQILALSPAVDVIHIEPVGWQYRADLALAGLEGSSQAYAIANDTNRNLWMRIKDLEKKGRVEIVRVIPDVYGLNPNNAASIIHWRKCA